VTRPEPLAQPLTIGGLRCHAIQAGGQRLDGGAMFGVVPKPLWEKRIPADDRNRIQLGMRCLLIEHPDALVLLDTGAGNKETAKFLDIYGIENEGSGARTALEDGIAAAGHRPEDVDVVINTHLHFDHAGGNTFVNAAGELAMAFPDAEYQVQRGEYDYATHTNERTAASYFDRNYVPIERAGKLRLLEGETEVLAGIRVIPTPGHTPFHQSVLITSGSSRACFLGDIAPTASHLPLPWIMGYDVEPLVSLETKRRLFAQALAENWLLIFEHDASVAWGHIAHDGKTYRLTDWADS
jgi:glyoxylase-like metal-dependent hydrolase (beta-lactamase superfamily II)